MTTAEINARAAAEFFGPAVYAAPRVVDVGEHKLDAWKLRTLTPAERSRANTTSAPAAPRPTRERNRHPFGRKTYGKARPTGGYVDPGTVSGKPWHTTGGRPTA